MTISEQNRPEPKTNKAPTEQKEKSADKKALVPEDLPAPERVDKQNDLA